MTTPFRIRIADPSLTGRLLRSLNEGDCAAVSLPDGCVEVVHRCASTDREARLELAFFLRAWQMRYPHAPAELVG